MGCEEFSGSGKLSIKDKIIVHSFANSDKVIAISWISLSRKN